MKNIHRLDGHYVRIKQDITYGNPGESRTLKAGTKALAEAATNLPVNSAIHYWLIPVGKWPEFCRAWAESVGCAAHTDDLEDLSAV